MKKYLLLLISLLSLKAYSQNLSYDFYSFQLGDMFNVNPAYCANDKGVDVFLDARAQNSGVDFADKNFMAGACSRVGNHQGLGLKVISDTRGAFQTLKADFSYAYIAQFATDNTLTLGLSGGIYNAHLNVNRIANYAMLDQTDPTLTSNDFNNTQFTTGAGLLYRYKNLGVSVSAPHMITTSRPYIFKSYINSAAFYTYKINKMFTVEPWVSYQNIPITKNVGSISVKGIYKNIFWLQAGYQTNQSIMASFGVQVNNIDIAYGFNTTNKDFRAISTGTNEVMFTLHFGSRSSQAAVDTANQSPDLQGIIGSLDSLLAKTVTPQTRASIRAQLQTIKMQLNKLQLDNSDPAKAKAIQSQLDVIAQKIKAIEKKLMDE